MSAYAEQHTPSPLAPLVDESRAGSAGGQAAIGIAGIVLAVILVMGQVSLATTKGTALYLHKDLENLTKGNQVMKSVIERAAPTSQLQTVLEQQSATLANTRDAMVQTNEELASIIAAKQDLVGVVGGMQSTSEGLASDVGNLGSSTARMSELLGSLPDATSRTHKQLNRINTDTNAINAELAAIGRKMMSYGLPHAKGAPTG